MRNPTVVLAAILSAALGACTPKLTTPRESIHINGAVQGEGGAVEISVYERCSPHLYVFQKCPGRFLGEAKIARPGPFLIEVDTESPEVSVIASRGFVGQEEECGAATIPIPQSKKPIEITLTKGPCTLKRGER